MAASTVSHAGSLAVQRISSFSANAAPASFRLRSELFPGTCSIAFPKLKSGFISRQTCSKERVKVTAACREVEGSVIKVEGLRFAVVAGRFNEFVTRALVAGALGTFKSHAVKESDIDVVWVPGSYEIPVVTQALAKSGKYHAVLCIGTVIRGETTHYDAVSNSAASGILSASINSGVPCIFGVLTCETLEQALHRAGGKAGNKGSEAALTAMEMASLLQHQIPKLIES